MNEQAHKLRHAKAARCANLQLVMCGYNLLPDARPDFTRCTLDQYVLIDDSKYVVAGPGHVERVPKKFTRKCV